MPGSSSTSNPRWPSPVLLCLRGREMSKSWPLIRVVNTPKDLPTRFTSPGMAAATSSTASPAPRCRCLWSQPESRSPAPAARHGLSLPPAARSASMTDCASGVSSTRPGMRVRGRSARAPSAWAYAAYSPPVGIPFGLARDGSGRHALSVCGGRPRTGTCAGGAVHMLTKYDASKRKNSP